MENQKIIKNRFENSKVYKLICNITGLIYVGSTTKELNVRLIQHKSNYKAYLAGKYGYVTSFEIIKNADYDIKLIKSYDFDNNIDLLAKEGYWVKKLNCTNKQIPGKTKAEKEAYYPKYRADNRVKLNTKANTVCMCACSCTYTTCHKIRHEKSQKHIKLMQKINPLQIP